MTPTVTLDPSGPWSKVRRVELFRLCQENGLNEMRDGPSGLPPARVMVAALSAKGVAPPSTAHRSIGKNFNPRAWDTDLNTHKNTAAPEAAKPAETVTVDADDMLLSQWKALQDKPKVLGFNEMRAELKAAGVRLDRKWDKARVSEEWKKLSGKQDAAQ